MSKVLVVDPARCVGCHSCEVACSTRNEGESNMAKSRIRVLSFIKEPFFFPSVCLQCETPYCASVCPEAALKKNTETGVVELDESKCIGCKMCQVACPFGNVTFAETTAAKCNLCEGDPTCVKVCQWGALSFDEAGLIGAGRRVALACKMLKAQKEVA